MEELGIYSSAGSEVLSTASFLFAGRLGAGERRVLSGAAGEGQAQEGSRAGTAGGARR